MLKGIEKLVIPDKQFEEKQYILLYILPEAEELSDYRFKICIGRTEIYNFIKQNIDIIDIHESKIITETKQKKLDTGGEKYFLTPIEEAVTVYDFMKKMESIFTDTNFDIEEYNDKNTVSNIENSEYSEIWKSAANSMKFSNGEIFSNHSKEDNSQSYK